MASHRAARPVGVLLQMSVVCTVALAAVGGASAWAMAAHGHRPATVQATTPAPGARSAQHPGSAVLAAASPWRTSWASSLDHPGALEGTDVSCRMVARVALGGAQVRFRLINYPSTSSVTFSHLVAAIRTSGLDVDPGTRHDVTVGGRSAVTLPPNGQVFTDPVPLGVTRGQDVALSVSVSSGTSAPWHFWSAQSAGCTPPGAGDTTADAAGAAFSEHSEDRWLSEVQVLPAQREPTVAVYGDSLTDGLWLPADTLGRWTDQLDDDTAGGLVVLNYGVAGDRITGQAPAGELPPRVDSDVMAPVGVSAVVVEMGSNDIRAGVSASEILAEYRLVAARVAAAHETLIVATVPPRNDGLTSAEELQRELLNQGLRTYPIVADIATPLTDPATGTLAAQYDIGDHIHPNAAGVAVIESVMRDALAHVPGAVGRVSQLAR